LFTRVNKGHSQHNPSLSWSKKSVKFANERLSRNGHNIKSTQPNLMILVSISSSKVALSHGIKIYITFSSQCTENPPFRFFGTPGIAKMASMFFKMAAILNIFHHISAMDAIFHKLPTYLRQIVVPIYFPAVKTWV